MARTIEDFFSRRTRALLLDARASIEAAPIVAEWMAKELGRKRSWQREQVKKYQELAAGYVVV
jgi:glycerol-3-phosphate dehydrogenase